MGSCEQVLWVGITAVSAHGSKMHNNRIMLFFIEQVNYGVYYNIPV